MSAENPSEPSEHTGPDHVAAIYAALGGRPVLLRIPKGKKRPIDFGWDRISWEDTQDPDYQAALAEGNVGVSLGRRSVLSAAGEEYHLCSIDIDETEQLEPFLAINERLRDTLITQGRRGGNLWLWVLKDSYPKFAKIKWASKEGGADGKGAWGEWRADGETAEGRPCAFQTVIYGVHPEGMRYRRTSTAAKPLLIDFREIVWPEGLAAAFIKTALERLIEEHGLPWSESKKGGLVLNPPFFVGKYAAEHTVLFEPEEGRFYDYLGERGLWCVESEDAIRWKFSKDFKRVADDQDMPGLETKRTNAFLQGLVNLLKGCTERREAFRREAGIVHLANGMLDVRTSPPRLLEFAASWFSRNQVPWALDESATCPVFLEKLVKGGIKQEADISLVKRWAGQLLLGLNLTQKIMVFTGQAGAGKSTLINVFSKILGQANVSGLRTEHLHQRFELWNYVGKTFLIGADVPGIYILMWGLCGGTPPSPKIGVAVGAHHVPSLRAAHESCDSSQQGPIRPWGKLPLRLSAPARVATGMLCRGKAELLSRYNVDNLSIKYRGFHQRSSRRVPLLDQFAPMRPSRVCLCPQGSHEPRIGQDLGSECKNQPGQNPPSQPHHGGGRGEYREPAPLEMPRRDV